MFYNLNIIMQTTIMPLKLFFIFFYHILYGIKNHKKNCPGAVLIAVRFINCKNDNPLQNSILHGKNRHCRQNIFQDNEPNGNRNLTFQKTGFQP